MKNHLFTIIGILIVNGAFSQGLIERIGSSELNHPQKTCGSYHYMEKLDEAQPGFMQMSNAYLEKVRHRLSNQMAKKTDDELLEVEVVFHVVYNNEEENVPDSVIFNQLEVLNACFRKQNSDTSNVREVYADIVADSRIQFNLATQDPDGNPTNGIVRTETNIENFGGVLPYAASEQQKIANWFNDSFYLNLSRISNSEMGGSDPWDTDFYLNIWIGDLRLFEPKLNNLQELIFLALATPPQGHRNFFNEPGFDGLLETLDDGVFMHFPVVGPNNPVQIEAPYGVFNGVTTEGKMMVHEVGHYLGLRHIWGDGDCSEDDYVDDTPKSSSSSNHSCSKGRNSCIDDINGVDLPDMLENYMDYSGSSCMSAFTAGQVVVMREVVQRGRESFVSVKEVENTRLKVYPNPGRDEVTIELGRLEPNTELMVYNSRGQLVKRQTITVNNTAIRIEGPAGVYIIEIQTGDTVERIKWIKG